MKVIGVVPARGGSARVEHKNMQVIGPFALVEHAIMHCLHSERLRYHSLVSTDSLTIALYCLNQIDHCPMVIERKCGGDGPMVDVLLDALMHYTNHPDAVVCVQPTSPLRDGKDIDACVDMLERDPYASSVVSIDESTGERNGAVYVTRVSMLRDGLVFDEHSLKYPMPHDRSIDINYPEDLEKARQLWAAREQLR